MTLPPLVYKLNSRIYRRIRGYTVLHYITINTIDEFISKKCHIVNYSSHRLAWLQSKRKYIFQTKKGEFVCANDMCDIFNLIGIYGLVNFCFIQSNNIDYYRHMKLEEFLYYSFIKVKMYDDFFLTISSKLIDSIFITYKQTSDCLKDRGVYTKQ